MLRWNWECRLTTRCRRRATAAVLGGLCVLSLILKTWFSNPNEFDWFLLAMGVVLCGVTFFRRVAVGARGFEAEIRELKQTIEAPRQRRS